MGVDVYHYVGVFAKVTGVVQYVEETKTHQTCVKCPQFRNTVGKAPKMEFCPYCGDTLGTVEEKYTVEEHIELNELITDEGNDESLLAWHCYAGGGDKDFYVLIPNNRNDRLALRSLTMTDDRGSELVNLTNIDHNALIAKYKEIFKNQLELLDDGSYPYEVIYGCITYYN